MHLVGRGERRPTRGSTSAADGDDVDGTLGASYVTIRFLVRVVCYPYLACRSTYSAFQTALWQSTDQ